MSEDGAEIRIKEKPLKVKILKTPIRTEVSTLKFDEFFGNSKVVDEKGNPKIVYHGSTQPFEKFDSDVMGDPEGYMGASYYFTDSETDVNTNYAGGGPDLDRRIRDESKVLYNRLLRNPNDYIEIVMKQYGIEKQEAVEKLESALRQHKNPSLIPYSKSLIFGIAKVLTREKLRPTEGVIYPVYLRLENPIYYQKRGGTIFNKSDIERFKNSAYVVAKKHGLDAEELKKSVEDIVKQGEVDVWEMGKKLQYKKMWKKLKSPETGTDMFGQLLADIYQNMGYDGVIINAEDVYGPEKDYIMDRMFLRLFGNKGMKGLKGATHYVVWESDQIRTAIDKAGSSAVQEKSIQA